MQNINVLIKGAKKTSEKAAELRDQLEGQLQHLEAEIDAFKNQLAVVDKKEREMLKSHTHSGKNNETQRQELSVANNALRTDIHKKLI